VDVFLAVLAALGVWLAVALVLTGLWVWWQRRVDIRHNVIVNCEDDLAFSGVLVSRRGNTLVMAQVMFDNGQGDQAVSVDGMVYLDRRRVQFIQEA